VCQPETLSRRITYLWSDVAGNLARVHGWGLAGGFEARVFFIPSLPPTNERKNSEKNVDLFRASNITRERTKSGIRNNRPESVGTRYELDEAFGERLESPHWIVIFSATEETLCCVMGILPGISGKWDGCNNIGGRNDSDTAASLIRNGVTTRWFLVNPNTVTRMSGGASGPRIYVFAGHW